MDKKTFKIYTLGCKVNQCDSRELSRKLKKAGLNKAASGADLAVVNSCAVTKTAIRKDKQMLTFARKENPGAKIVLMGCWPEVYPEDTERFQADLVWGTGGLGELSGKIQKIIPEFGAGQSENTLPCALENAREGNRPKARYFLKIQDGCSQFCAYCIIPHARGPLASRPSIQVIREAEEAVNSGAREIVLTGIHLGLYAKEKKSKAGMGLEDLIERIASIPGLSRLRLSSIELNEVSGRLARIISENGKVCKHLHIPLQGGTDSILKAMGRPYKVADYLKKIKSIRKIVPEIAISTDVITGFPGETKEDFAAVCRLVGRIGFSRLHVFPFSAHEKARASKFPGQVSSNELKRRSKELRAVGEALEKNYKKQFKNKKLPVLLESERPGSYAGKTEYYFERVVKRPQGKSLALGSIVDA